MCERGGDLEVSAGFLRGVLRGGIQFCRQIAGKLIVGRIREEMPDGKALQTHKKIKKWSALDKLQVVLGIPRC
jgi:hypothetical protein